VIYSIVAGYIEKRSSYPPMFSSSRKQQHDTATYDTWSSTLSTRIRLTVDGGNLLITYKIQNMSDSLFDDCNG
jgi:hypothetical protein